MAVPFIGYKKIKAFEGYVFCSIVGKLLSYFGYKYNKIRCRIIAILFYF